MWTPNMREPVAKMLCHLTAVKAVAVDPKGMLVSFQELSIWSAYMVKKAVWRPEINGS